MKCMYVSLSRECVFLHKHWDHFSQIITQFENMQYFSIYFLEYLQIFKHLSIILKNQNSFSDDIYTVLISNLWTYGA